MAIPTCKKLYAEIQQCTYRSAMSGLALHNTINYSLQNNVVFIKHCRYIL